MKVVTQVWAVLALLNLTGEVESAARFLSHVPHDDDDYATETHSSTPDYDSDVKLPGRHYPKLPYRLDTFPESPYLHHHSPGFDSRGSNYDQQQQQQLGTPSYSDQSVYGQQSGVNIYGHSSASNNGRLNTESSNDDGVFYNTDDETSWRADEDDEDDDSGQQQHLASPQSDTAAPPAGPTTELPTTSPFFDRTQPRSFSVQAGKTAVLVCRVLNIGDKSVSWMRHEDLHILTVDKYKYSTDNRIGVVYNEGEHEWLLKIQGVRQEDAGRYECQVSTKPVLSFIVNLDVVVPSASIMNGAEIHVHRGSLINLTCVVEHTTERPLYIVWYHYNKVIDYEVMGGVVVVTQSGHNTVSHLLVKNAEASDSGKYTCRPSNGEDASVMLHVLNAPGSHADEYKWAEPGFAGQCGSGRRGGRTQRSCPPVPMLKLLLLQLFCYAHMSSFTVVYFEKNVSSRYTRVER
ncbi:immunoglobulin superfamily member 10 isoform X2 [Procambarus clarkii]|uniref:immunoglobulin superfamily member 10 isoform X2 n=1 Tax=Procambarus clarkii TaxID=6728 RepID=UPI003743F1BB